MLFARFQAFYHHRPIGVTAPFHNCLGRYLDIISRVYSVEFSTTVPRFFGTFYLILQGSPQGVNQMIVHNNNNNGHSLTNDWSPWKDTFPQTTPPIFFFNSRSNQKGGRYGNWNAVSCFHRSRCQTFLFVLSNAPRQGKAHSLLIGTGFCYFSVSAKKKKTLYENIPLRWINSIDVSWNDLLILSLTARTENVFIHLD